MGIDERSLTPTERALLKEIKDLEQTVRTLSHRVANLESQVGAMKR